MPEGWRPRPKIIEFLNMADYTHQVRPSCAQLLALLPLCLHASSMARSLDTLSVG